MLDMIDLFAMLVVEGGAFTVAGLFAKTYLEDHYGEIQNSESLLMVVDYVLLVSSSTVLFAGFALLICLIIV